MTTTRRGPRAALGGLVGFAALGAIGVACLEAPTLDDCYSVADCPGALFCVEGLCTDELPDAGPEPDAGPPPSVTCAAELDDDGALAYDVLFQAPSGAPLRLDAVAVDGRLAVAWQGPESTTTRVACFTPGEAAEADPFVFQGSDIGASRPAIARDDARLVAAWTDGKDDGSKVVVQGFGLDCVPGAATGQLDGDSFSDVQLAAGGGRLTLGARHTRRDRDQFGLLYFSELGPRLTPGPFNVDARTVAHSFALADDGGGPAVSWTQFLEDPFGESGDDVVVVRSTNLQNPIRVSETGALRVAIDGMVPSTDGFTITWRVFPEGDDIERHVAEVRVQGVNPGIASQKQFTVAPGGLFQPADLAFDVGLDRTALVTADDGRVRFWSLDAGGDTPVVELDLADGAHPAVVVMGDGHYGVLYGADLDGLTYLKLAQVRCAPVETP